MLLLSVWGTCLLPMGRRKSNSPDRLRELSPACLEGRTHPVVTESFSRTFAGAALRRPKRSPLHSSVRGKVKEHLRKPVLVAWLTPA
jgi:hypothetical protein